MHAASISRFGLALALSIALSACASVSTDPREDGLMGGLKGMSSGAYEDRLAEREADLDALESIEQSLNVAIAQDLETANLLERRIGVLQPRILDLKRKLNELERRNDVRDDLSENIADLMRDISRLESDIEDEKAIQQTRLDVQSEIEELRIVQAQKQKADALDDRFASITQRYETLQNKGGNPTEGS